jgi:hypothetical protein
MRSAINTNSRPGLSGVGIQVIAVPVEGVVDGRQARMAKIASGTRQRYTCGEPGLIALPGRSPASQLAGEAHGLVNRAVVCERPEGACEVGVECGALVG